MKKRIIAALIWFYTGWYGGALLADFLGLSLYLGPLVGAAVAALIAGDPRGIIWKAAPSISTAKHGVTPDPA